MHGGRIKQTGADTDRLECTAQTLAMRGADGVLMKHGVLSFKIRWEEQASCREPSMIAKRMCPPNLVLRIEVREADAQDGSLDFIEAAVPARRLGNVTLAPAVLAEIP